MSDSTREGVAQTLAKYALGVNESRPDLLEDCFTDGAVLGFPASGGIRDRGRDAIVTGLLARSADRRARNEQSRHVITNLYLEQQTETSATAISYYLVVETSPDSQRIRSGWYRDSFVNEVGTWRIEERNVHLDAGAAPVSPLL